jgi:H+/gluconate symporter-like permease
VALLLTTLFGTWLLGTRRGMSRDRLNELLVRALEPAGIIILITGAGGVLKQVLVDTGVGKALAMHLLEWGLGPLTLGFCVAWVVRVMQGSATVAMLTSAGLVVPTLGADVTQVERALCVIAVAAGATCTSIVNDSGFWLVGRYLGLSVPETLRTWSVLTTIVGSVGFLVVLLLHWLLG